MIFLSRRRKRFFLLCLRTSAAAKERMAYHYAASHGDPSGYHSAAAEHWRGLMYRIDRWIRE